jgi:hypothetical protein
MADPIVVRTTKAVGVYPKGAELGYRTETDAKAILGEGNYTVVSLQNGQPAPAKTSAAKTEKKG